MTTNANNNTDTIVQTINDYVLYNTSAILDAIYQDLCKRRKIDLYKDLVVDSFIVEFGKFIKSIDFSYPKPDISVSDTELAKKIGDYITLVHRDHNYDLIVDKYFGHKYISASYISLFAGNYGSDAQDTYKELVTYCPKLLRLDRTYWGIDNWNLSDKKIENMADPKLNIYIDLWETERSGYGGNYYSISTRTKLDSGTLVNLIYATGIDDYRYYDLLELYNLSIDHEQSTKDRIIVKINDPIWINYYLQDHFADLVDLQIVHTY